MIALGRFLSRLGERGLPFYKALAKTKGFVWNNKCQEAFGKLKEYLASLLVLAKP